MCLLFLCAFAFAASASLTASSQQQTPPPPAIKVGQQAPGFTLHYLGRGQDGKYEQKTMSLGEFKGHKSVILAFFPAAFSPG